jgi:hypothetical protein
MIPAFIESWTVRRRRPALVATFPPRESVTGWVSQAIPLQPSGGVGAYTFTLSDELGTLYTLRRERRGGWPTG